MRILPMGQQAVLVEELPVGPAIWGSAVRSRALAAGVELSEVVPAARTVLIVGPDVDAITDLVNQIVVAPDVEVEPQTVLEIAVHYDGADLAAVAETSGLSVEQVIERHASAEYHVAFCGFAPGFGYLAGLPESLHLPRRDDPRPSVPAGSVAIAAGYTAVYPRSSPGGWHLLGRTDIELFDSAADPPSPMQPGRPVRFVPR